MPIASAEANILVSVFGAADSAANAKNRISAALGQRRDPGQLQRRARRQYRLNRGSHGVTEIRGVERPGLAGREQQPDRRPAAAQPAAGWSRTAGERGPSRPGAEQPASH
jgi:hypothetical protein